MINVLIGDFMIAGGIILFCIAIVVTLGTSLLVGPAVLTTSLIIIPKYGTIATLLSIFINILLTGLILLFSDIFIKILGETGAKALSKITSLLLTAIGIMMTRNGIIQFLQTLNSYLKKYTFKNNI